MHNLIEAKNKVDLIKHILFMMTICHKNTYIDVLLSSRFPFSNPIFDQYFVVLVSIIVRVLFHDHLDVYYRKNMNHTNRFVNDLKLALPNPIHK